MVARVSEISRNGSEQPMNEDDNELEFDYQVALRIEDIHLLHHCVLKRIETWEGSPSRHPTEQEHLNYLKNELYRAILDYKFNCME